MYFHNRYIIVLLVVTTAEEIYKYAQRDSSFGGSVGPTEQNSFIMLLMNPSSI